MSREDYNDFVSSVVKKPPIRLGFFRSNGEHPAGAIKRERLDSIRKRIANGETLTAQMIADDYEVSEGTAKKYLTEVRR